MVISVGSAHAAELAKVEGATPVMLVDCDFSTGHRRFAMWHDDVDYNGDTYVALGPINEQEATITSETPLTEQILTFTIQGDPTLLTDLAQNSRNRWCDGYLVHLIDGVPADDEALHLWHRRMVPGEIVVTSDTYIMSLALESRFHRPRLRAPRTYSHAEQQALDPTDFAFRDAGKQFDIRSDRWRQKSGLGG